MSLKQFVSSSLAAISIGSLAILPAEASSSSANYTFKKVVGNTYIHNATVIKRSGGGTRVKVKFTLPACSSRSYLYGTLKVSFYSKYGGYMRDYTIYSAGRAVNNEGQTLTRSVWSRTNLTPSGGRVWVSENFTCKSLAPLNNNIGKPNTDWLKRLDPTRGIFY